MKDKKNKCKQHESTIGKIIYGFLLFMPLMAIATTCLITTFNMASKEEAEIHYKYETNNVTSANDLIEGNIYHFVFDFEGLEFTNLFESGNIYNIQGNADCNIIGTSLYKFRAFCTGSTGIGIYAVSTNLNNSGVFSINNLENHIFECDLIFSRITYNDNWQNYSISNYKVFDYVETNNVNAQDVFYNSIDRVENSNLFNWAKNNAIYTGVYNTCQQLSITSTFIPMLLTYWLIISVMYFLYDIILIILNILHKKIHELQESI